MFGSLVRMHDSCEIDLWLLERITLGDYALLGDNSTSRMTSSVYPYYYDSSLIMQSEIELRR